MRKLIKYFPVYSCFSIVLFSCGKTDKNPQNDSSNKMLYSNMNSDLNEQNLNDLSEKDITMDPSSIIPSGDTNYYSILQGFNKMGFLYTEKCIDSENVYYPKNVEKSIVNLSDNMKEEDFRNALNIGVSASVPVKVFQVSPEIQFSRDASVSRLSRSTTYSVYVRLGDSKLKNAKESRIYLKPFAYNYFDSQGKLKDPYNFIKKCGDEVVVSQKLSSRILITLKLNFDSMKTLNTVESKLGVAQNILSVGGKIGVNGNVKYLDEETKKGIHLNLHAVQIGGNPAELTKILNLKNNCEITKLDECQSTIDKLNKYVSEDYNKQLDPNNYASWAIESSQTVPYDELNVLQPNGKTFNFSWLDNYDESVAYSRLKNTINQLISKQVDNYSIANSLLNSLNLAADEKKNILEVSNESEMNIDILRNFSKECYKDLSNCLATASLKINNMLLTYDESFLKPNIGTLIAKIRSSQYPLPGQKNRSSENFLDFKSIINSGKYSSLYFRLKTIDNKLITNNNIRFDIMCDKPWYRGFDPIIFSGAYVGYEILIGVVQSNHDNLCSGKEMGYVASPRNVPYSDFILEVWGRD
ncbi:hypothetical protein GCL60_05415 [Silvanigrella paludirubra]|uniref:MACPF domain-containing protein n=1 Tax=Silvanigrella paludirubra TaxID=2499159 RepID=A0A6N6VTP5_9BACT|nr:hypothetical protein [Silvanigrella paludirubra]KAB8039700.1 hypothetical protein GCL60_05415 [Silvanigrella paludirubra]